MSDGFPALLTIQHIESNYEQGMDGHEEDDEYMRFVHNPLPVKRGDYLLWSWPERPYLISRSEVTRDPRWDGDDLLLEQSGYGGTGPGSCAMVRIKNARVLLGEEE